MSRTLVCRILSIQRHKRSYFLYVAGESMESQLLVSPSLAKKYNIVPLSVLFATVTDVLNDEGKVTLQIQTILLCVNPSGEGDTQNQVAYVSNRARNYRMFRHRFIEKLSQHYEDQGFHRLVSPLSMSERGTSTVAPVRLVGGHVDRYLKITHELELKREMAYTLEPFFEIGYVARDVCEGRRSSSEYLVLEFVAPVQDISIVSREILSAVRLACEVADELCIKHRDYSSIDLIDVNKLVAPSLHDERVRWFGAQKKRTKNALYLNAPTNSPLVKESGGVRRETVWVVEGNSFAHGYRDENDYHAIYQSVQSQKRDLAQSGIEAALPTDFLDILKLGIPDSVSMGLGLDRFLTDFLEFSSIREMRRNRHWRR
jgi:lysyl-tRNA synthetase class II